MAHVLVVDDDLALRHLLVRQLERLGHRVADAENGRAALARFRDTAFDVVLLDIFMPDLDGLELIQQLRREHPETRVVAMSGGGSYGLVNVLDAAAQFGAHGTVRKPASLADIAAEIEVALASGPAPATAS